VCIQGGGRCRRRACSGPINLLFNSYEFIFLFLPLCTLGYYACARHYSLEIALGFLVVGSLIFYGYCNPAYLLLLLGSTGCNFLAGRAISGASGWGKGSILALGIAANLGLLAWFKYADLLVGGMSATLGARWEAGTILLPLAISFYTFQQVAFLVDAYRGEAREPNFLRYSLFVCFFPQLLAGPIVRHRELMPQFSSRERLHPLWSNMAIGVSIFAIGLFKKTVLADGLAGNVEPVFDTRWLPKVDFFLAWGSSLSYTFQLYFDFSGYSDMAVGVARIFGVRLPVNFFSPYKATSIIEFWRRWHITLSRYLRDYLRLPLGDNGGGGEFGKSAALFFILILVGLWHGASWTFLVWGAIQGGCLAVNHIWRTAAGRAGIEFHHHPLYRVLCWILTFAALVFSWVYFRAPTLDHGNRIALAMLGLQGFEIPAGILARAGGLGEVLSALGFAPAMGGGSVLVTNIAWVAFSLLVVLALPNVAQIFSRYEPVMYENDEVFRPERTGGMLTWRFNRWWAFTITAMAVAGFLTLQQASEFIYFRF